MIRPDSITILVLDIDGVLTDGRVAYTAAGEETKALSYHDVDAVFEARRRGLQIALVTAEDTPWVDFVSQRLQVDHVIRGARDKLEAVRKLAELFQIPLTNICYLGDSDRDAPALAAVGLGIAPANATAKAKAAAHKVLRSAGGYGAVHKALEYVTGRISVIYDMSQQREVSAALDDDQGLNAATQRVREIMAESVAVQQAVAEQLAPAIANAARMIANALESGNKVLIFGNGGSAADAQHMVAELVGRFEQERPAYAAIALTTNTSVLTALSNDYGEEAVFARQLEALARAGDIAVAISTSGNSRNVLAGVRTARNLEFTTIALTGSSGGLLGNLVDLCIRVPADKTARVQEAHGLIIHAICLLVEDSLEYSQ